MRGNKKKLCRGGNAGVRDGVKKTIFLARPHLHSLAHLNLLSGTARTLTGNFGFKENPQRDGRQLFARQFLEMRESVERVCVIGC